MCLEGWALSIDVALVMAFQPLEFVSTCPAWYVFP